MSSQKKRDLEFKKAEEVYVANLLRLMGKIFLVTPQRDSRKINIAKDLKREVVKKRIELITAPLFYLGIAHADELIEQYRPKTTSAGRAPPYLAAAKPPTSYNEMLIIMLTQHTMDSMIYVADNTRKDLINSLNEGYTKGEGIPALTKRVQAEWLTNKVSAKRFARTFTNEVYNQAHFNRYQESTTVDGIQFSAHLDSRTSEQCRMLNMTIWAKGDPDIQLPPLHFNCRSRTLPYFGKIPGKRDFRHTVDGTEFTTKDISKIQGQIKVFKTKYWNIPISEIPRFPGR
jgi:SPP1 gp7 family putative phage head morphogenesis protein